VAEHSQ
jgi:hypothetical protein